MADVLDSVGRRVVDAGLASALLTALAALAMIVTRQPARRRALARAAILSTLLAIPLVCLRPFEPLDLVGPFRQALGPALDWIVGPECLARVVHPATIRPASSVVRSIPGLLLLGYMAIVAARLGRVSLGWLGTIWLTRRAASPSGPTAATYATLPFPAGRGRPRLRVSARARRPVLMGAFRPTILIPPDLDRPEAARSLRLALLHELAHAGASDSSFGLASELASSLWFWLPTLLWIRRQMRLDQEFLADREASSQLGASSRYASSLVEIAAAPRPPGSGQASPAGGALKGSSLFQRVLMLVRCPFPIEAVPPRRWRGALALATIAALLSATGLTLRATPSKVDPGDPRLHEARSIFIPQIILQGSDGPDSATGLPVRLPEEFDLSFEIYARSEDVGKIRLLGHSLPPPSPPNIEPRWHGVRLSRRDRVVTIAVDRAEIQRSGDSDEIWLTIQGASGVIIPFRFVRLTW